MASPATARALKANQHFGLVGPFTAIARTMSQQWAVQIIPNGFECKTDGKRIWIPFAADHLPEDARQILHGMLDHEVCHVVEENEHTEAGRRTPLDLFKMEKNKTILLLLNVMEDIRIEIKWSARYPGVAENLSVLHAHTTALFKKDPKKMESRSWWDQFAVAFISKARGWDLPPVSESVLKGLAECDSEVDEARHLRWGQDSYDLAERVYKKLRREHEETMERAAKAEKKKAEKAAKEAAGKATGGVAEEADEEGESGTPEATDGDDEAGEADAGDEESDEGEEGPAAPGEDGEGEEPEPTAEEVEEAKKMLSSEATITDPTKIVGDSLEKAARADARSHKLYVPDPKLRDKDIWQKPTGGSIENYQLAREQVLSQIGAIRGRMLAFVQTITRKRTASGRDSGDLDGTRLADVRIGHRDVFTEVVKGIELDTAIEVLLDLSGSMGAGDNPGCPAYFAKRSAICLVEAWEPLRIPNEFIGFTNNHSRAAGMSHDPDTVRRVPFDFHIFKAWGEPLKACRERFSTIRGYQDNADGEAVHAAACRLAIRPEKRKILVVISDGYPAHSGIDFEMLNEHLKDTVRAITKAGIEVLGVGAGTDAPTKFYNKSTGASNMVIMDLGAMAPALFNAMRERILGK